VDLVWRGAELATGRGAISACWTRSRGLPKHSRFPTCSSIASALGLLTVNAMAPPMRSSMPLQCEFFALEVMSSPQDDRAGARRLTRAGNQGVILTMFDKRNTLLNSGFRC
jgi:hypothetical protein